MILSVGERVIILSLLPVQGSFATLKILELLRMSLSFAEKELKEWGIEEIAEGDKLRTYWETDGVVEIPIGEKATDIIVDALKKRDRENNLPMQATGVYEKFIQTTE